MYQAWKVTNNAQKMSFPWTINISKNCRANQGSKIGNIQGSDISDFWGRRVCQGGRGRQTILGRPPPYFCASGANWRRPWAWRRFEYFGLPSPNLLSAPMDPTVPKMAPEAMPTHMPIMKPSLTRSKQEGPCCPSYPAGTGILSESIKIAFNT